MDLLVDYASNYEASNTEIDGAGIDRLLVGRVRHVVGSLGAAGGLQCNPYLAGRDRLQAQRCYEAVN